MIRFQIGSSQDEPIFVLPSGIDPCYSFMIQLCSNRTRNSCISALYYKSKVGKISNKGRGEPMQAPVLQRPRTFSALQEMNEYIFGEKNEGWTTGKLIERLLVETTFLIEIARKDYREKFGIKLADILSWHSAVTKRLGLNVGDILWQKYPGVCSYCLRPQDCKCGIEHPDEIENKDLLLRRFRLDRDGREPQTIAEHQAFHKLLYGWQHGKEFPVLIAAHIVEEAGEVSWAFSYEGIDNVVEELADVLSWVFALANRLGINLENVIWEFYTYFCRTCHQAPCLCENGTKGII